LKKVLGLTAAPGIPPCKIPLQVYRRSRTTPDSGAKNLQAPLE
jgi:hypothetical protein